MLVSEIKWEPSNAPGTYTPQEGKLPALDSQLLRCPDGLLRFVCRPEGLEEHAYRIFTTSGAKDDEGWFITGPDQYWDKADLDVFSLQCYLLDLTPEGNDETGEANPTAGD